MDRWQRFDRYVQDAMPGWHCPGAAVAVVQGDEVTYRAAHGLRDVDRNLPLTTETRFAMASVTKSATAMSVALLVDEGKLAWDRPVREVVPELILHDPYASAQLSLRDMLSHRSGLPRHDMAAWRLDLSRAEFVKRMRHLRFSAGFRERFQYNNLMYYLTAHVVERVAGQRWEDFVRERIFEPLGMTASNFVPDPPREGQVTAIGYRAERDDDGRVTGLRAMPFGAHTELSPGAAGALFSNLDDQVRWLGLHVNRGRWGDLRLVSEETCGEMHRPVTVQPSGGAWAELMGNAVFTYALGWSVEPYRGHTLVQHGGNVEGHSLMVGFVPRERLGVVVLTNGANMPLRDALLYEALDTALGLEARDWSARMHGLFDEELRGMARGKTTAARERVANAPPSHALDDYAGTFRADGYPDFAVRITEGELQARLVGSLDWTALRHLHFDVFDWELVDFDETMVVRFAINGQGEIDAVVLPIETEVDDVTFRRRPVELPQAVVEALLGGYDTAVAGLSFTISRRAGKLYVTPSGDSAEELSAYLLDEGVVGLRAGRTRYEFAREGDWLPRLTVKAPGMVWEATRRAAS